MPDAKDNEKDRKTRQEIFTSVGYYPSLPKIESFNQIINYINELGLVKQGFHGHIALEWKDVQAWLNVTATRLETWEVRFIIELSKLYCSCLNQYREPRCPQPYKIDPNEDDMAPMRRVVDSKIRGLLKNG